MAKGSRGQDVPKGPRKGNVRPGAGPGAAPGAAPGGAKTAAKAAAAPLPEPARNFTPRGIAAVLAPILRPAFKRRAPAAGQIIADWETLAGPALARAAAPVKFAGGTLTLACGGGTAMELQHRAPEIIQRLNLGLGRATVERLRFVAAESRPESGPPPALKRRAPAPPPPEGLPEGKLGEALARLHSALMTKP